MPRVIDKASILKVLDGTSPAALMAAIERSFTSYTSGEATVPPVGSLEFEAPPGGVHIKYGYLATSPYYVIKIASGFYDNPKIGLPSSNGLNLVFRQQTGELAAILLDEGYLTDLRTALAGAVVAKHFAPPQVDRIGIIGTGLQARMQLEQIGKVTACREVIVWGRSEQKTEAYRHDMEARGFRVSTTLNAGELTRTCNLIVTTTPSKKPILPAGLRPGSLVIAMGADTPGKQELAPAILAKADLIVLDSYSQCTHHGEIHKAYAGGLLRESQLIEIGDALMAKDRHKRTPETIVVADLTGIATQDMLISELVLNGLNQ